jgi:hypothetical protein
MKTLALTCLVLLLHCDCVLALGGDYPPGMPLLVPTNWPTGLADLRDHQGRVHGYFLNFEDLCFYSGDAASFNRFLTNYTALPITSHTLVLHRGYGTAKSPWNRGQGIRCDWKMYVGPRWLQAAFNKPAEEAREIIRHNPGYAVRLDLWLNGGVDFAQVKVPACVTVIPVDEEPKIDARKSEQQKPK